AATPASGATQAGNKDMQELKIIAKAFWPYASARPGDKGDGHKLVLRSAAELVVATPFSKLDAPQQVVEKKANDEIAKVLKIDGVDWQKRMLIVVTSGVKPSGGYSVEITDLKVADKTLTVT